MDFLQITRSKILRTQLYGDQQFDRFELEILHTPIVQRLYNLKQLGFTDRVFPDAVHARFNHVLGVVEVVDVMRRRLISWLETHAEEEFWFYVEDGEGGAEQSIKASDLAHQLKANKAPLRLMGMLHDLTHAAFGHTLEDEVNVFHEKHDDPRRQKKFFNSLVAQLLYLWCTEERLHVFDANVIEELSDLNVSPNYVHELRWAQDLAANLQEPDRQKLASYLRDLEFAFQLLLHLDVLHTHDDKPSEVPLDLLHGLLVSSVIRAIDPRSSERAFVLHRDTFMVDLVGNTICADLLDYARRDAHNAGLRIQFDDRFLRYLCVASVRGALSPTRKPCIRTAIQIFTDKMRHDVLSEMSGILKARYLINERVLFHPTKCAAGAMLGTAVQLLGLKDLPAWMQVLGDQEFLRVLIVIARNLQNVVPLIHTESQNFAEGRWTDVVTRSWAADDRMATILADSIRSILGETSDTLSANDLSTLLERSQSARNVLWQLKSRRFPKLAYRLRDAYHTAGASDETVAETYSRPTERYQLERLIEYTCALPMGTVFIHCPRRKTSMKVAEVLVVGGDISKAAQLRDLTKVSPKGLQPYEDEIKAVQDMYRSIWQFHAYLDVAHWEKQPLVSLALERKLTFPNDELLSAELSRETHGPYGVLVHELKDEFAPIHTRAIASRIGAQVRARHADPNLKERLRSIIRQVNAEEGGTNNIQLDLPGVEIEP